MSPEKLGDELLRKSLLQESVPQEGGKVLVHHTHETLCLTGQGDDEVGCLCQRCLMHFCYEGDVILHPHVVEKDVAQGVCSHLALGWVEDVGGFVHIDDTQKLLTPHQNLIVGVRLGHVDLPLCLMRRGVDVSHLT